MGRMDSDSPAFEDAREAPDGGIIGPAEGGVQPAARIHCERSARSR